MAFFELPDRGRIDEVGVGDGIELVLDIVQVPDRGGELKTADAALLGNGALPDVQLVGPAAVLVHIIGLFKGKGEGGRVFRALGVKGQDAVFDPGVLGGVLLGCFFLVGREVAGP